MSSKSDTSKTYSSPCLIGEIDSIYRGFLVEEEVLEFLNILLKAERAGAKVCQSTIKENSDASRVPLLESIKRDEVMSCRGLISSIRIMDGNPCVETGDFYDKCMALQDLNDRIKLLNKGQQWVVRKIKETLPGILNKNVRKQLTNMLKIHEDNIELITNSIRRNETL